MIRGVNCQSRLSAYSARRVILSLIFCFLSLPAFAGFAQQQTWGGTSAGVANAQTIRIGGLLSSQTDLIGVSVSFLGGFTNTGATTLTVGSGALTLLPYPVKKASSAGLQPLSGGEICVNSPTSMIFDGTEFVLQTNCESAEVGSIKLAAYGAADAGYLLTYGECEPTNIYPVLYARIGDTFTTQDGCAAGFFGVPDLRGRTVYGQDNMGGTAAGRITTAGGNFDGTVLGNVGGVQNRVVNQANLAAFSLPSSASVASVNSTMTTGNAATFWQTTGGGGIQGPVANTGSIHTIAPADFTLTTSVSSGGSSTPMATLSNGQVLVYEIKY